MCILLVDDEDLIRDILADELDFQGFEVCKAETGDQAAALIKNPPKVFSLLITDVHMPGNMDGIGVARLMRLHHPGLPIIYTTGRPDTFDTLGPLGPKEILVAKPYTATAIVDVIRRLLGNTSAGSV
jgi:DNA-binding response OmpR family regulator